ncbi:SDR family oxidoreductase [Streptomyces sp. RB6PN25]|uniref:SDR family oxidoreductase n=1 Tax=Streptomyces humicola TaxID=2953240 RepID=A0ABT1Q107_9ACTN|nr:SDR family oxidoreductase [Streptomyces humicola]MCQ4082975.1 SDR family oxidoreductase [Streptomyces humicola]
MSAQLGERPERAERAERAEHVVVVGGTSGIGLAAAERQLRRGREVVVTGRDPGRLTAALKELEQAGAGATGEVVDARDDAAMRGLFGRLGAVDHVVVTVTGASAAGPFRSIAASDLRAAAEGKLVAQSVAAQAALEVLRPGGSLTFVSAGSAGAAIPGTAGLAAVNAAVEAMIPVLAVELAPTRVNAVSPGIIDTPWWDWLDADARQQTFDAYAASAPAGRVGRAGDVADAIGYLIEATFVTGVVLPVDGGARHRPASASV